MQIPGACSADELYNTLVESLELAHVERRRVICNCGDVCFPILELVSEILQA